MFLLCLYNNYPQIIKFIVQYFLMNKKKLFRYYERASLKVIGKTAD